MLLKDKVIIVTGSTRGIGKGIATQCAKEGAKVTVCGTKANLVESIKKEFKDMGYDIDSYVCDVTDKNQIESMMKQTFEKHGRIDAVVANAGITDVVKFEDIDEDRWDRMLDTNLKSVYLTDHAALPYLKKNANGGKIVNISSDCGVEGWGNHTSYSAAKFGIRGLSQALAKELGPENITVNVVCPGIIDTDMWKEGDAMSSEITGDPLGASWQANVDRIPLGRAGTPADLGNGVVILLSDYADYITGTTLMVGGGSAVN
jgi:meso-butanediol dehydrogenase/(S,S)-butanediol dehydrogenase/diacetyl reductase